MNLFYTPDIEKCDTYVLNEIESKHAIKVLRLKEGDLITLINGKGMFFEARITEALPKKCQVLILNTITEKVSKPHLHIAIAPTKNNDRLEWFVEKCTEIGIGEITPIICHHSERKNLREDRLVKTAVAAMKQSLKATLPKVNPLISFKELMDIPFEGKKYIAHCYGEEQIHLKNTYNQGDKALVLIGPEGDFSKEEIDWAIKHNFEPITFGESRLRTETAGVVACNIINLLNE